MKKGISLLLAGMLALSLAACGGDSGSGSVGEAGTQEEALSDEEIIAAAQGIHIGDFEKTLGEYIEGAEAITEKSWYLVTEENTDGEVLEDLEDDYAYDPETERLVCADITSLMMEFYVGIDPATGEARLVASFYNGEDDAKSNLANFLYTSVYSTLTNEETIAAAENSYLPGYPDATLGEYIQQAILVSGSYSGQMLPANMISETVLMFRERCPEAFHIETDKIALLTVWIDDLQGNHQLTYRFYVAVNDTTGESTVAAASAAAWENGREGDTATRYGSEVEDIADIFMEAVNWAG